MENLDILVEGLFNAGRVEVDNRQLRNALVDKLNSEQFTYTIKKKNGKWIFTYSSIKTKKNEGSKNNETDSKD